MGSKLRNPNVPTMDDLLSGNDPNAWLKKILNSMTSSKLMTRKARRFRGEDYPLCCLCGEQVKAGNQYYKIQRDGAYLYGHQFCAEMPVAS